MRSSATLLNPKKSRWKRLPRKSRLCKAGTAGVFPAFLAGITPAVPHCPTPHSPKCCFTHRVTIAFSLTALKCVKEPFQLEPTCFFTIHVRIRVTIKGAVRWLWIPPCRWRQGFHREELMPWPGATSKHRRCSASAYSYFQPINP